MHIQSNCAKQRRKGLVTGLIFIVGLLGFSSSHGTQFSLQLNTNSTGQCLEDAGTNIYVGDCVVGNPQQTWNYDGSASTLKTGAGLCIDGSNRYQEVSITACNGTRAQKWRYESSTSRFKNNANGLCLALYQSIPYGIVGTWTCLNDNSQEWNKYAPPPVPTLTDSLINGAHGQCMNSGGDDFVDVRNCDSDITTQQWGYNSDSGQLITSTGRCIQVNQAFDLVTQNSCSSNTRQQWRHNAASNTFVNAYTGQCLDVWGGEIDNEIGVWTCDGSDRQAWKFAGSTPPPPNPETTNIRNLAHGQCMVNGSSNKVDTTSCDLQADDQQWHVDSISGALVNNQGLCIDASTPWDLTTLQTCNGSNAQKWSYTGSKNYVNASHGQCLDVWGGAVDNEIGVWTCDGSPRQQFEKHSGSTPGGPTDWQGIALTLNGRTVGIDSANNRLLFSLADGFDSAQTWSVTSSYNASTPYTLKIANQTLSNESPLSFDNIKYGSTLKVERFEAGALIDEFTLVLSNLPIIQLTADLITDEPKRQGTFQLSSGHFGENTVTMNMGIETRGATSQAYPKKSFSLQIGKDDDWSDELKLKLLDMRKDGDWILDAAYRDTTFVRNLVNHNIFREIHPYVYIDAGEQKGQPSIRGELVEVILNGAYYGVYVLSEKVDRKLLDLSKVDVAEDADGNELWNEVDFNDPKNGSTIYKAQFMEAAFLDINNYRIGYEQKYPDPDDEAVRWEPLDDLAELIINSNDADFTAQVGTVFDMDSLVDFWALVLASHAEDNTQKNFYFSRNEGGKFALTTWDFDATFGMFWDGSATDSVTWFFPKEENKLIDRLMSLPATGFNAKLKARWTELRASSFTADALAARFQQYIDQANLSGAGSRNAVRWPESGGVGAGDPRLGTSEYIRTLLQTRLDFVDQRISQLP